MKVTPRFQEVNKKKKKDFWIVKTQKPLQPIDDWIEEDLNES
jgi:hypothetical protein